MNKKFLSAILFGALAVTSTGSFVSCKDYDDDIDNLQTQINGLASAKDLSDKVSALQSAISSAQTAAEAKAAAAQTVADAAKAAADKAGADAADVKKALDAAVADLEAKGATKEELEAAKAVAAEAKAAAEKAGDDAAAAVKAVEEKLEAAVKAADDKAAAAAEAAAAAQKAVDELAAEAASKTDLAAVKTAAEAAKAAADKAQAAADEAKAAAAENKAALAEAATKAELAGVAAKVTANTAALAAKADAETVEALEARVKALEEAIPGLDNEEAVKALAALATTLKSDVENMSASLGIISKRLTSLVFAPNTYIDGIETIEFTNLKYSDWGTNPNNWLRDAAGNYAGGYVSVAIKVDENNKPVEFEKPNPVPAGKGAGDYGCVAVGDKWYVLADTKIIGDNNTTAEYLVSPSLGVTLDGIAELSYLGNKATNATRAIGAAPIKVVEALPIKDGVLTLKLAKVSAENDILGTGKEEWNNASIWPHTAGATSLEFPIVSLKATLAEDVLTAEEKEAGTEVNVYSDWTRLTETTLTPYIANAQAENRTNKGVLLHNRAGFYTSSHYWPFHAIYEVGWTLEQAIPEGKTELDLTYSPWNGPDGNINEYSIGVKHVYKTSLNLLDVVTVCAGDINDSYWHTQSEAKEIKNYAEFGLEFEFHIMPYLLKNNNSTIDATPQEKFAKLAEDGHTLIPTSRDGEEYNADAVTRTPVIQAVLKDVNNDKVVDVRYFKVQWTEDVPSAQVWKDITVKDVPFACDWYQQYILEEDMNYLYAHIIEGGMKPLQFHQRYDEIFQTNNGYKFFAYNYTKADKSVVSYTAEEIMELMQKKNTEELDKLGFGWAIDMWDNTQLGQTHNVLVQVNANDYRVKHEKEEDFTIKGVFAFTSSSLENIVVVPVTMDVKAGTVEYDYNYLSTQWEGTLDRTNKDKYRPVNPTLESDAKYGLQQEYKTTQLRGDLAVGYIKDGKVGTSIENLLAYYPYGKEIKPENNLWAGYAQTSDILFDESRLAEVTEVAPLDDLTEKDAAGLTVEEDDPKYGWNVDLSGKYLYYAQINDDNEVLPMTDASAVIAARINEHYIWLVDNRGTAYTSEGLEITEPHTVADANYPTDAALRLVGKKAPVKVMRMADCVKVPAFDQYLVYFIDPLKKPDFETPIELIDIVHEGDAKEISTLTTAYALKEAFGGSKAKTIYPLGITMNDINPAVAGGKTKFTEEQVVMNQKLIKWYGIVNLGLGDKDNWLINVGKNGEQGIENFNKLSDITVGGEYMYSLSLLDASNNEVFDDPSKVKKIMFHNINGDAITKKITIKIPFTFDTKWKLNTQGYIVVTLDPNLADVTE